MKQILVEMPPELLEKIEAYRLAMEERQGMKIKRNQIIMHLLRRGMEEGKVAT